jgi:glycosyltransferase involved in cell wall biosynthesis
MISLSILVPCFNEEAVLPTTTDQLLAILERLIAKQKISKTSHICYVDDGSSDGTWDFIEGKSANSPMVNGIKLSRNRGHQNALLAGLLSVEGDAVISIDADLQDDVEVIENRFDSYLDGNNVVYGVREERASDTLFKRSSAKTYYRLLKLMGADVVMHHADFRLLSRKALRALKEYGEVNLFLRGIVPTIGFSSAIVTYARKPRVAGESEYPIS